MIFAALKRKSNQIFFKKISSVSKENEQSKGINQCKSVLVFLDDLDFYHKIEHNLIEILALPPTAFEFVIYQQKLPKNNNSDQIITPHDFGWYGKLKSDRLKNILTNKYDLLINYNKIDHLYTNLLVLQSKVKFKVGFANLKTDLYDLTIQCNPNEIELFTKEIDKYLNILIKK